MDPLGRFHHLGYATPDMEREEERLATLGYGPEGDPFEDPLQGIRGRFLTGGGPRIELLSDLGESGTLAPLIQRGTVLYHLAYECPDLEEAGARLRSESRAKQVRAPLPSVAFGGRAIAFFALPNRLMVELIGP